VNEMVILNGGLGDASSCAGRSWPAPFIQKRDIKACRPLMTYYNVPCTAEVIECLLFRKEKFLDKQRQLRALSGQRPAGVDERMRWLKSMASLIDGALDDTNLLNVWMIGGTPPTDYNTKAALASLPGDLWANGNAFVNTMLRSAVDRGYPCVIFPAGFGFVGDEPAVMGDGSVRPFAYFPMYHRATDFVQDVRGRPRAPVVVTPGTSGVRGLRGLGFGDGPGGAVDPRSLSLTARAAAGTAGAPGTTAAVRRAMQTKGWFLNPFSLAPEILAEHLRQHPGTGLVVGSIRVLTDAERTFWTNLGATPRTDTRDGVRQDGWMQLMVPAAGDIMDYYAAVARDIQETAFEVFVLYGMEKWAQNLMIWAQNGRVQMPVQQFVDTIRTINTARLRATSGAFFGVSAGLASAVNPVAGAVMQILGTAADALVAAVGAGVGGWNCPLPLTRRSASGDCDFTHILGPGALEQSERQRGGMVEYFTTPHPAPSAPSTTSSSKPSTTLILGGVALVAALGIGYVLLSE